MLIIRSISGRGIRQSSIDAIISSYAVLVYTRDACDSIDRNLATVDNADGEYVFIMRKRYAQYEPHYDDKHTIHG